MTTDKQTIAVYDLKAEEYAEAFSKSKDDPALALFISKLPMAAKVLDLGCGPGSHAAAMHAQGLKVTATDASMHMVRLAQAQTGIKAYHSAFSDLRDIKSYDGIWANFCLLHAPRSEFRNHLNAISTALKPNGIFHLGMKTGFGEKRDHLGRCYTYYTSEELRTHLKAIGFKIIDERSGQSAGLAGTVDPWIELLTRLEH